MSISMYALSVSLETCGGPPWAVAVELVVMRCLLASLVTPLTAHELFLAGTHDARLLVAE